MTAVATHPDQMAFELGELVDAVTEDEEWRTRERQDAIDPFAAALPARRCSCERPWTGEDRPLRDVQEIAATTGAMRAAPPPRPEVCPSRGRVLLLVAGPARLLCARLRGQYGHAQSPDQRESEERRSPSWIQQTRTSLRPRASSIGGRQDERGPRTGR